MSQPLITFRAFNVQASVFESEDDKKSKSVVIKKSYKNEETGKYKDTTTFFADDLPRLSLVAMEAYRYVTMTETDNT